MRVLMRTAAVVLCCSTLAGLLVGCGSPAAATSAPTVDPVTQACLSVLHPAYGQYYAAAAIELDKCYIHLGFDNQSQLLQVLPVCRPLETAAHDATQSALTRLATAAPPARWQTADAGLKQALQALLPYYVARANAIADSSTTQFTEAFNTIGIQAFALLCQPIATFNAGPPQLSPQLQVPIGPCDPGGD